MNKKLICFVATLLVASMTMAQVNWTSIEDAAKKGNTKTEKLYFVDFYTDWCGWCKKMDKETFQNPIVMKILNKYYIPVKFNAESMTTFDWNGKEYKGNPSPAGSRKQPHQFTRAILGQKMGYPTTVIFKADQSTLNVLPGYFKPEEFTIILWYFASGDYTKYSWEQYSKIFDSQIRPKMNKTLGIK